MDAPISLIRMQDNRVQNALSFQSHEQPGLLLKLPHELQLAILSRLPPEAISSVQATCRLWRQLGNDEQLWRNIFNRTIGSYASVQSRQWQSECQQYLRAERRLRTFSKLPICMALFPLERTFFWKDKLVSLFSTGHGLRAALRDLKGNDHQMLTWQEFLEAASDQSLKSTGFAAPIHFFVEGDHHFWITTDLEQTFPSGQNFRLFEFDNQNKLVRAYDPSPQEINPITFSNVGKVSAQGDYLVMEILNGGGLRLWNRHTGEYCGANHEYNQDNKLIGINGNRFVSINAAFNDSAPANIRLREQLIGNPQDIGERTFPCESIVKVSYADLKNGILSLYGNGVWELFGGGCYLFPFSFGNITARWIGEKQVIASNRDGMLMVRDLKAGKEITSVQTGLKNILYIEQLSGHLFLLIHKEGNRCLMEAWDLANGKPVKDFGEVCTAEGIELDEPFEMGNKFEAGRMFLKDHCQLDSVWDDVKDKSWPKHRLVQDVFLRIYDFSEIFGCSTAPGPSTANRSKS